jgi:glycosyltransferase involved in cell wall biosynthesis
LKILFVCSGFTVKMSGGDYHMIKVAHDWSKTNSVYFLIPKLGHNFIGELLAGKALVYETPLDSEPIGTFKGIVLYFLRTVKASLFDLDNKPDIIIASSHYPFDVIPGILHNFTHSRSKFIVYFHGLSIPEGNLIKTTFSKVYNLVGLSLAFRRADLFFVINSQSRNFLLEHGITDDRIVITNNGVDSIAVFRDNVQPVFDGCFVGRLVKNKGVYDLISIWKKVCDAKPNAKLAILGDGPEKELLNKRISEMGLEKNIVLFGFVFGPEKDRIIMSSMIFVFPSHLESWGISIAEAMACGLPVVAYDLRVFKEVFEDNLFVVPLKDVNAMAEQVIFLLNNSDISKKIGEKNKQFVKRYNWSVISEKELSVMINLLYRNR